VNQDPYSNPFAFFAGEMKRMRAKLGMTQEQLADSAGFAPATVAAVETCRLIPSSEFAEHIDKPLHGDGHFVRLEELVERTCVRPWFRDRVEVERKAREIREYESYQVPGLLQTEDYARASISAARPMMADDAIERAVALRMTRQEILDLDRDIPAESNHEHMSRLWAIIEESSLHRVVGSTEIMRAQRDHLADMALRPNITIQIIPNGEGVTCAYGKAFTILTSNSNSSVVYLEDVKSAHYLRDRDQVAQYTLVFDHLRTLALDDRRSLKLIKGEKE
jgi:DNA-binding XRE family transcriptional regulator